MNYYNEIDPFAAAWLRALMAAGQIPEGVVDEQSIELVRPGDLIGYAQCHFFAGIGGWPYALRLAGWPDDEPIWTGSCPCQPFSAAGSRRGAADKRHLWPHFERLIQQRRPPVVTGEQVASPLGRGWLAGVRRDLEALGYRVGAADLCASGVGAPHIRQRLYWVADAEGARGGAGLRNCEPGEQRRDELGDGGGACGLGDTQCDGGRAGEPIRQAEERTTDGRANRRDERGTGRLGHALPEGLPASEREALLRAGRRSEGRAAEQSGGALVRLGDPEGGGCGIERDAPLPGGGRHPHGASWARFDVVHCRDGKARRFEPQPQQMADGIPAIVGRLRADAQQKIEEQIADAEITKGDARKALRDLWIAHAEETLRGCTGGLQRVPEATILLAIMRELAREGWRLIDHLPQACFQSAEDGLRELRQTPLSSSCPPFGLEPSQQRAGKSTNAMSILSQAFAREAAAAGLITYPLAEGRPGRVGRLRGYGNAIVPQVAAEFIRAYRECRP